MVQILKKIKLYFPDASNYTGFMHNYIALILTKAVGGNAIEHVSPNLVSLCAVQYGSSGVVVR